MTDAFVGIYTVAVIVASACLQVTFPAFAVFKAFTSALFFALVVDAFFVRFAAGIGNATIRYGLATVIGQRFARAAIQINALIVRAFLRCAAMAVRRAFAALSARRIRFVRRTDARTCGTDFPAVACYVRARIGAFASAVAVGNLTGGT